MTFPWKRLSPNCVYALALKVRLRDSGQNSSSEGEKLGKLQELAAEIERLARRAFPTASADIRDHLTRDAFVDALDPPDLSLRVRVQEPKTLQDALTSAIKLEVVLNQMENRKAPPKNPFLRGTEVASSSRVSFRADQSKGSPGAQKKGHTAAQAHPPKSERDPRDKQIADLQAQVKHLSTQEAGLAKTVAELTEQINQLMLILTQTQTQGVGRGSPFGPRFPDSSQVQGDQSNTPGTYPHHGSDPQCGASGYNNSTGHRDPLYYHPRSRDMSGPNRPPDLFDMSDTRCFNCSQLGHLARNCPYRNGGGKAPVERTPRNDSTRSCKALSAVNIDSTTMKNCLRMKIGHEIYPCLLDSGCDLTVLPVKVVPKDQIQPTSEKLFAANGAQIPILGRATLPAQLGDFDVEISGLVSHHVQDIIIGADWLSSYDVSWNMGKDEVSIQGHTFPLFTKGSKRRSVRRVIIAQEGPSTNSPRLIRRPVEFKDYVP